MDRQPSTEIQSTCLREHGFCLCMSRWHCPVQRALLNQPPAQREEWSSVLKEMEYNCSRLIKRSKTSALLDFGRRWENEVGGLRMEMVLLCKEEQKSLAFVF